MRLDAKALTLALGLLWGGMMSLVGLSNLAFSGYAEALLAWAGSVYPGY